MNDAPAATPIGPVALGSERVLYAPAMRAGPWVFASGHMAQDYGAGIAADVLRPLAPNARGPKRAREAARAFDNVQAVLDEAKAGLGRIVRTDQFYTGIAMVPPFQAERRRRLGRLIPPSTSIIQQGLLLPDAELDWQVIALADGGPRSAISTTRRCGRGRARATRRRSPPAISSSCPAARRWPRARSRAAAASPRPR